MLPMLAKVICLGRDCSIQGQRCSQGNHAVQAACSRQEGSGRWQRPDAAAAREPSPDDSCDMMEGPCKCQMSLGGMGEQLLCSPGGLCTCLLFVICLVTPAGKAV